MRLDPHPTRRTQAPPDPRKAAHQAGARLMTARRLIGDVQRELEAADLVISEMPLSRIAVDAKPLWSALAGLLTPLPGQAGLLDELVQTAEGLTRAAESCE